MDQNQDRIRQHRGRCKATIPRWLFAQFVIFSSPAIWSIIFQSCIPRAPVNPLSYLTLPYLTGQVFYRLMVRPPVDSMHIRKLTLKLLKPLASFFLAYVTRIFQWSCLSSLGAKKYLPIPVSPFLTNHPVCTLEQPRHTF